MILFILNTIKLLVCGRICIKVIMKEVVTALSKIESDIGTFPQLVTEVPNAFYLNSFKEVVYYLTR